MRRCNSILWGGEPGASARQHVGCGLSRMQYRALLRVAASILQHPQVTHKVWATVQSEVRHRRIVFVSSPDSSQAPVGSNASARTVAPCSAVAPKSTGSSDLPTASNVSCEIQR